MLSAVFSICQWGIGLFYLRNWMITFYLLEHQMFRNITGYGEGRAIHDGILGTATWANFLKHLDQIILETHFAFGGHTESSADVWPSKHAILVILAQIPDYN